MAQVIIRLTLSSNAIGPFDIHTGSTQTAPIAFEISRDQLTYGYSVNLDGSERGIRYDLFIVSKESECGNVISKEIIVYDDDESIRSGDRTPTVTPSPTTLNIEYALYLFNSVCVYNGNVKTKFFNIPTDEDFGTIVSYENECWTKSAGPLDLDYRHPFINTSYSNDKVCLSGNPCSDTFKTVNARRCCDNLSTTIFNVPNDIITGQTFIYQEQCFEIFEIISEVSTPGNPRLEDEIFYQTCGDCLAIKPCLFVYECNPCCGDQDTLYFNIPIIYLNDPPNSFVDNNKCYKVGKLFAPYEISTYATIDVTQITNSCEKCRRSYPCTDYYIYSAKKCCNQEEATTYFKLFIKENEINNTFYFSYNDECYYTDKFISESFSVFDQDLYPEISQFYVSCNVCQGNFGCTPTPTFTNTPTKTVPIDFYTIVCSKSCCSFTDEWIIFKIDKNLDPEENNSVIFEGECYIIETVIDFEVEGSFPTVTEKYDNCETCSTSYPCPTPTPTITPSATDTRKYVYASQCCPSEFTISIVVQTDKGVQLGDIINIEGVCYSVSGLNAPQTGDYYPISTFNNCEDCQKQNPCPTPTPTPNVTPTLTRTVTATRTLTPTKTQTVTPSGIDEFDLDMGVEYETGSTIANYSFTASTAVTTRTVIEFTNYLYYKETARGEVRLRGRVTIEAGETVGTGQVTSSVDLTDLIVYQVSYEDVRTTRGNTLRDVNKYTKVVFPENAPITAFYQFASCCYDSDKTGPPKNIFGAVDATAINGWVSQGYGITYSGYCYYPRTLGNPGPGDVNLGTVWGPDNKGCDDPNFCVCPTPTPTKTAAVTETPTNTPTRTVTKTAQVTPTRTITPTKTPPVTQTKTPAVTLTPVTNYECWTVFSCCNPTMGNIVSVAADQAEYGKIVTLSGQCYTLQTFAAPGQCSNVPQIVEITEFSNCQECISSGNTCVTPTPTMTSTVTQTNTMTPTQTPTNTSTNTPTITSTKTPNATDEATQTPTVTSTPTLTPSPTRNLTAVQVASCCFDHTEDVYIPADLQPPSGYTNIIGSTIRVGGECMTIINLGGQPNLYADIDASGNTLVYSSCTSCTSVNICPTPTPTQTASVTPSVTASISSTPATTPTNTITRTVTQTNTPTLTYVNFNVYKCNTGEIITVSLPQDTQVDEIVVVNSQCYIVLGTTLSGGTVDVGIRTTFTDCVTCNNTYPDVTPTPFVTSTATLSPTPTLTNTRTVTPTNQNATRLVYAVNSGCTVSQGSGDAFQFLATNLNPEVGQVGSFDGFCWEIEFIYPEDYPYELQNPVANIYFGYDDVSECQSDVPCPSPTPTTTVTKTNTSTPTNTSTNTSTPTNTPTNTSTPTNTPTETFVEMTFVSCTGCSTNDARILNGLKSFNIGDVVSFSGVCYTIEDKKSTRNSLYPDVSLSAHSTCSSCISVNPCVTPTPTFTPTNTPTPTLTSKYKVLSRVVDCCDSKAIKFYNVDVGSTGRTFNDDYVCWKIIQLYDYDASEVETFNGVYFSSCTECTTVHSICPSQTPTLSPTKTVTPTITQTNSPTLTNTPTNTLTRTVTQTLTSTVTASVTPSVSLTGGTTPTPTETITSTPTMTSTSTNTPTPTKTVNATQTPTMTKTPTRTIDLTPTNTSTPTNTATNTSTPTNTPTNTSTVTNTPTNTVTKTSTSTNTPTPTVTTDFKLWILRSVCDDSIIGANLPPSFGKIPVYSGLQVKLSGYCYTVISQQSAYNSSFGIATYPCNTSDNPCFTPTPTAQVTLTPTQTITRTNTVTPSVTRTSTVTPTNTPTNTATLTNTVTNTPTKTNLATPTVTPTTGITATPTKTQTPTPTLTPTSTLGPIASTPTPTKTQQVTPTNTPTSEYKNVILTGNCSFASILFAKVPTFVNIGEIVTVGVPVSNYTVNQCYKVWGDATEDIYASLIGQPTNYTGLTQCQQDNNPCYQQPAPTPTSTTTPTSTNTPTVTQTVTTTSGFRLGKFVENCCASTGITSIESFNVQINAEPGDVYFYGQPLNKCYTLLPDETTGGTTPVDYQYLTFTGQGYQSCVECRSSEATDPCPTPPVTATNTVTPSVTPTKTVTKTPRVTRTVTRTVTPTKSQIVSPTPTMTANLIKVQISGQCSGNVYDVFAQVPIFFDQTGLYNGECASVVGLNAGNPTGNTIFTPTYFTGNTVGDCLSANTCPTPTPNVTSTPTFTPTMTKTNAATSAPRYSYKYFLCVDCNNENFFRYFNIISDFPENGVIYDPETEKCFERVLETKAPNPNNAPSINSYFTSCETCYTSKKLPIPSTTPTLTVTKTQTPTGSPTYRLRLVQSCCSDEYIYVNAPQHLPVGTIGTVNGECYTFFESLSVGPFVGYDYITVENYDSCTSCTSDNTCYSLYLIRRCNNQEIYDVVNIRKGNEVPFSVIYDYDCWEVLTLIDNETNTDYGFVSNGLEYTNCDTCLDILPSYLESINVSFTPTPNVTPTHTPTIPAPKKRSTDIVCLSQYNEVSVINEGQGDKYVFGNGNYGKKYGVNLGTYVFENVPFSNPITFLTRFVTGSTVSGEYVKGTKTASDGNIYTYYYGDVTLTLANEFDSITYESWSNGYLGGQNNLVFESSCDFNISSDIVTFYVWDEKVRERRNGLPVFDKIDDVIEFSDLYKFNGYHTKMYNLLGYNTGNTKSRDYEIVVEDKIGYVPGADSNAGSSNSKLTLRYALRLSDLIKNTENVEVKTDFYGQTYLLQGDTLYGGPNRESLGKDSFYIEQYGRYFYVSECGVVNLPEDDVNDLFPVAGGGFKPCRCEVRVDDYCGEPGVYIQSSITIQCWRPIPCFVCCSAFAIGNGGKQIV